MQWLTWCIVSWKSCFIFVSLYSVVQVGTCSSLLRYRTQYNRKSGCHVTHQLKGTTTRLCVHFHLHILPWSKYIFPKVLHSIPVSGRIFLLQACLVCSLLCPATWRQIIPLGIGLNPVTPRYPTYLNILACSGTIVGDPDPQDPRVLWPPGSGSISQRYGSDPDPSLFS
jgi:hypothetical protein